MSDELSLTLPVRGKSRARRRHIKPPPKGWWILLFVVACVLWATLDDGLKVIKSGGTRPSFALYVISDYWIFHKWWPLILNPQRFKGWFWFFADPGTNLGWIWTGITVLAVLLHHTGH